jgi:hypothetical protein
MQEFGPVLDKIMKTESTVGKGADIEIFIITECIGAQTALQTLWCSVHFDYGLCMNSFRLVKYGCMQDSIISDKSDIETFVITEGNRTKTALETRYRMYPF